MIKQGAHQKLRLVTLKQKLIVALFKIQCCFLILRVIHLRFPITYLSIIALALPEMRFILILNGNPISPAITVSAINNYRILTFSCHSF